MKEGTLESSSLTRRFSAPRNRQRGAAALLEAAMTMAILLAVIFGIIDFSRALYAYHFVSHAAREATRYASVRGTSWTGTSCTEPTFKYQCMTDTGGADVFAYVKTLIPTGIPVTTSTNTQSGTSCNNPTASANALGVCAVWPGVGGNGAANNFCDPSNAGINSPGCVVAVTVQYNFKFLFGSLGILPSGAYYTLSSKSQIVIGE